MFPEDSDREGQDFLLFVEFLRIAELVRHEKSLNSVSKKLGISSSTTSKLFDEIEQKFGKVFTRRQGVGGGTNLTPEGQRAIDEVLTQFKALVKKRPKLTVACSENLITNRVLSPIFAEEELRQRFDLDLRLESRWNLGALIRRIQSNEVSVACLWGTDARLAISHNDIICDSNRESEFDLVVVSHRTDVIQLVNEKIQKLEEVYVDANTKRLLLMKELQLITRRHACVILDGDSQPFSQLFDRSLADPEDVKVDTYDAAIAVIRSQVAVLALIPAVYPTLLRIRSQGEIVFSKPVGRIPIALYYLRENEKALASVVKSIKNRLSEFFRKRPMPLLVQRRMPKLQDCVKLKYGYYIDAEPGKNGAIGKFAWKWQVFRWRLDENRDLLVGRLRNLSSAVFDATMERFGAGMIVKATGQDRSSYLDTNCVPFFISVFTVVTEDQLLLGTWTTLNNGVASVYGTILSGKKLSPDDLRRLQASVNFCSVLSTNTVLERSSSSDTGRDEPLE